MSVKWPTHEQFLDTEERAALARLGYAASWRAGSEDADPAPLRKLEIDLQLAIIAMRKRRVPKVPKTLVPLAESYRGSTWAPVANTGTVEAVSTFVTSQGSRRSGVSAHVKVNAGATLIGNYVGALVQGVQLALIDGPGDVHPDHQGVEDIPAVRAAAAVYRGFIMPYKPHSMMATNALLHQLCAGSRAFVVKSLETAPRNRRVGKFVAEDFSRRSPLFAEQFALFEDIIDLHELERIFPASALKEETWLIPASKKSRDKIWFDVAVLPRLQSEFETLLYVGTFKRGRMHGRGLIVASNAARPLMVADFVDGLPHGKGFLIINRFVVAELAYDKGAITKTTRLAKKQSLLEFKFPVAAPKKPPPEKTLWEKFQVAVATHLGQDASKLGSRGGEYTSPAAAATVAYANAAAQYVRQTAADTANFVWETVLGPPPPPPKKERKRWHILLSSRQDVSEASKFCKWLSRTLSRNLESPIFHVDYDRDAEYDLDEMKEVMDAKDIFVPLLGDNSFHEIPFWVEAVTAQHCGKKCVPVSMNNRFPPLRYRSLTYHDILGLFTLDDWRHLDELGVLPIDVMQAAEWILKPTMLVVKHHKAEHAEKLVAAIKGVAK